MRAPGSPPSCCRRRSRHARPAPDIHRGGRRPARPSSARPVAACGRRERAGAAWYRSAQQRRRWSRASGPSGCRCSTTPRRDQARTARRVDPAGRARCVRAPPVRCARRAWRQTSAPPRPGRWRVLRHGAPGAHTRVEGVLALRHSRSVIGAVAVVPGGRSLACAFFVSRARGRLASLRFPRVFVECPRPENVHV